MGHNEAEGLGAAPEGLGAEFAFVIPWGRFVYKRAGKWNIVEAVTKESIREYLLNAGISVAAIKALFQTGAYPKVFGAGMYPGRKEMFEMVKGQGHFYLNTWVAPTLVPSPGEYPRIDAALDWLTDGDTTGKEWLIHWMARKVQSPELVPKVAVVLLGKPGSGKGTFGWLMRQMLGVSNCAVIERHALESQFNSSWIGKLFVQADEIVSPEHMKSLSEKLKMLITSDELEIEAKGRDRSVVANRLAWLFCSNDRISPLVLEEGDRRYSVFANYKALEPGYDATLRACFQPDDSPTPSFLAEVQGFYAHLLALDVRAGWVAKPYDNAHRETLLRGSERGHESFIRELRTLGFDGLLASMRHLGHFFEGKSEDWDFAERGVATQLVYDAYKVYCDLGGYKRLTMARFGAALTAEGFMRDQIQIGGVRRRTYRLPRVGAEPSATTAEALAS